MIRFAATRWNALLAPLALLACDQQTSAPPGPEPSTASFDNKAAGQSIVRAEVIAEVEPMPTPSPTPSPTALPTATVPFARGAGLDDAGRAALDRLLADPVLPADAHFVLRGHSDSEGSDRDNLLTSRRRAEAVRDYLAEKGLGIDRVEVIALGERRPVAPNATLDGADDPAGRALNRRVEVQVLPPVPTAMAETGEEQE